MPGAPPVSGALSAPQVGAVLSTVHQYIERVARITTPFDAFVDEFSTWANSMWLMWIVAAVAVALVIAIVVLTRSRARAKARIPQYRRRDS